MGIELKFDEGLNNREREELVRRVYSLLKEYTITGEGIAHVNYIRMMDLSDCEPKHKLPPPIQILPDEKSRIEEVCRTGKISSEGITLKATSEHIDLQFKEQRYRIKFKGFGK